MSLIKQKGKKGKGKIGETLSDSDSHKFKNIVITDEERNAIDQINLHESLNHHELENKATSQRNDVDFDEKYVELKKKIAEVDKHMTDLKAYVDNSTKLIINEIRSSRGQPTQTAQQEVLNCIK
ncbi:hypothetical protein RDI58_025187 [Solanum bulbocastanum]|uniref:Uncharacterized protein n=1 Tax=Solanum bulbocastanum TaxID=147425 RepID=A0AAN8SZN0_SOLBU